MKIEDSEWMTKASFAERQPRPVHAGDVVIWHDPVGKAFKALVTAVWSAICLNLVLVSDDESQTDPYGRQIFRQTSQTYKTDQPHGMYWRFEDDEPNPIARPVEA